MFKSTKFVISAIAFAISLAAGAGTASAAGGSSICTVEYLVSDTGNSPTRVNFKCIGESEVFSVNYVGCEAINIEQIKIWTSMVTSAFLSGKRLQLWWDDACGSRAVTSLVIIN